MLNDREQRQHKAGLTLIWGTPRQMPRTVHDIAGKMCCEIRPRMQQMKLMGRRQRRRASVTARRRRRAWRARRLRRARRNGL